MQNQPKAILINPIPRNQKALARVEALALFTGMSKSQAAVFLIESAPEPLSKTKGPKHDPKRDK